VKGKTISGDIFVSLPRILDNASTLSQNFESEFNRVLAHGILHLCGYKDKTEEEQTQMRAKEDFYINHLKIFKLFLRFSDVIYNTWQMFQRQ
jgi:rRNA maturation RNase YbeY